MKIVLHYIGSRRFSVDRNYNFSFWQKAASGHGPKFDAEAQSSSLLEIEVYWFTKAFFFFFYMVPILTSFSNGMNASKGTWTDIFFAIHIYS